MLAIEDIKVYEGKWPGEKCFSAPVDGKVMLFYWTLKIPNGSYNQKDISIDVDTYKYLTGKDSECRATLSFWPFTTQKSVKEAIIAYIEKSPRVKGEL